MNNLKKIALISGIIAILLISIAIFWHYVIYLPAKDKTERITEAQEKFTEQMIEEEMAKQQEIKLDNCLKEAEAYNLEWREVLLNPESECDNLGCLDATLEALDEAVVELQQEKENCLKKYPVIK